MAFFLVPYTPKENLCRQGMLSASPQHSAFWNVAFWSLSSFAFGRTWFPASTGGGGGESLYSPPSKDSKGFLNILNYVSKSSMNQNEADFIGNKKKKKEKERNTGFVACNTFGKPTLKYLSWHTRTGSAFQLPRSLLSNGARQSSQWT